jgi:hypothetical protein
VVSTQSTTRYPGHLFFFFFFFYRAKVVVIVDVWQGVRFTGRKGGI